MIETSALCLFLAALPLEQFSALGVSILKLAGGIAFGAWLLSRVRALEPVRWDRGLTMMLLFTGWGMASVLWSVDRVLSLEQLPTYALLLMSYLLIVNVIRYEKQWSAAMTALWIGSLLLLATGVAEVSAHGHELGHRVEGVLGNPNGYVAMLVASIPSGYWFYRRARALPSRILVSVAAVLAAATSLYSLSRGGVVSIISFLMCLLVFRQTRRRGVAVAALLLVLSLWLAPRALWERWEQTRAEGGDIRTRELWPAGLKAFSQRPLTGFGLGTNAVALFGVRGTKAGGALVHSAPLAIAVELGIPGLVLYIGFIVYAVGRLLRAIIARLRSGEPEGTVFACVLVASFAGYMATWLKGGGTEYSKVVWVLLGLMSVHARTLEQSTSTTRELGLESRLEES